MRAASPLPLATISLSGPQQWPSRPSPVSEALAYVQYKVLQALMLPAWGKVLLVAGVGAPILAAGAALLVRLTGERLGAALLRCYLVLNNVPGTDVAGETDPRAAVVLNVVYGIGLLTFAVVIGVLGDDIASAVQAARVGNARVPERNHTVILGHNRQLVEVVRQVAAVRADRGCAAFPGPLVVLSPLERSELEAQLAGRLGGGAAAGVVARQGSPMQLADLHRVSAGQARTVILLAPEAEAAQGEAARAGNKAGSGAEGGPCLSAEAQQAVTLAALRHLRSHAAAHGSSGGSPSGGGTPAGPQTVVVQQGAALGLMRAATGGVAVPGAPPQVVSVSSLNRLARLQAQCAAQPGLAAVLTSLMQQRAGSPEFYVQHVPEVTGLTYGEARRLFPRAVLCGVYDPFASSTPSISPASSPSASSPTTASEAQFNATSAAAVQLNPRDSTLLLERHSLILLADTARDLRPVGLSQEANGDGYNAASSSNISNNNNNGRDGNSAEKAEGKAAKRPAKAQAAAKRSRRVKGAGGAGVGTRGAKVRRRVGGRRAERGAAAQRVVVLSFDGRSPTELLSGLRDYCPRGSQVVVIAPEGSQAVRERRSNRRSHRPLRVRTLAADPRVTGSLLDADVQRADAVILTGLDGVAPQQADAQALATQLQLQAALQTAPPPRRRRRAPEPLPNKPLTLVCAVTDPRVREVMAGLEQLHSAAAPPSPSGVAVLEKGSGLAAGRESAECGVAGAVGQAAARRGVVVEAVQPDEMLAGVLTQVAAEPRLAGLFHELSSPEGVEIYLRTPAALDLPYNQPLTWQQVQDGGRRFGVTIIGALHGQAAAGAAAPRLQLGVPSFPPVGGRQRASASDSYATGPLLTLQPGDKLVVLAEDA